jgi:hypothetical protein
MDSVFLLKTKKNRTNILDQVLVRLHDRTKHRGMNYTTVHSFHSEYKMKPLL